MNIALIGGGTMGEAIIRGLLKKKLADGYFKNPQVSVAVETYRSQRIFIVGEVRNPAFRDGTDAEGARMLAERMRARIEGLQIENRASSVGPWLTVSLGVATIVPRAAARPEDRVRFKIEFRVRVGEPGIENRREQSDEQLVGAQQQQEP